MDLDLYCISSVLHRLGLETESHLHKDDLNAKTQRLDIRCVAVLAVVMFEPLARRIYNSHYGNGVLAIFTS